MSGFAGQVLGRRSLLGAACLQALPGGSRASLAHSQPDVVATFSILRDFVVKIAGQEAEVATLVGNDGDTHTYEGRPADVQRIARARMLVSNGMGFEPWLPRLLSAAHFSGLHVGASDGITPLMRAMSENPKALIPDPHCWHDVANARRYVGNIVSGFEAADRRNTPAYRERARDFDDRLLALDRWVREQIGQVPPDKRRVITDHDAFGYFAHAYGVEFLAARGLDAGREPSAKEIGVLINLIRSHRVKVLFFENLRSPALIETIARDSGGIVGQELYSDALSSTDGPASSYEALMRHNVSALVAGMMAG